MKYLFISFFYVILFKIAVFDVFKKGIICPIHHTCFTKYHHNFSKRISVQCEDSCKCYGCNIDGVIYKGSGCSNSKVICDIPKNAKLIALNVCLPQQLINLHLTDFNEFGNLSDDLCDYDPKPEIYFRKNFSSEGIIN